MFFSSTQFRLYVFTFCLQICSILLIVSGLEFEKLSIKFKELRSLAINYKEDKEKEIEKLKSELNKFETLIEENRNAYEEILDKTTKSIEKFIENSEADQEKNVQ